MDTGEKPSVTEADNKNQNEVSPIRLVHAGEPLIPPDLDKSCSIDTSKNVPSVLEVKPEPPKCVTIPSITITPASPLLDSENLAIGHDKMSVNLLCPPPVDKLKTPNCPNFGDADDNQSKCIDTSNDEDLEVICRCSSTPIKGGSRKNETEDANCSMSSIGAPSPISRANVSDTSWNVITSSPATACSNNNMAMLGLGDAPALQQRGAYHNPYGQPNQGRPRSQPPPHVTGPSHQMAYDMSRGSSPSQLPPNPHQRQHENEVMLGGQMHPPSQHGYGHGSGNYNDYYPSSDNSWTDMSYRSDVSPVPHLPSDTPEQYFHQGNNAMATGAPDNPGEYFVYPSIYVSSAGLISVLLRNDMSVEMTVDRTVRVVSHNHMMAVAIDSRGTSACLYHPAVKAFQMGTTTDIASDNFRARMGSGESIVFSNGFHYFKLEESDLQPTAPVKFSDILRDQSVNLLFSSEGYGESLVASCMQVAAQAEYANLPKGGVIVRINGVKVTQTGCGDVSVVTGAKFIRLSPHYGTVRLGNRFVDIEIEKDWTVKLTRGAHGFVRANKRCMVCNGKMEAGFDENNQLKVSNLVPRHPLLTEAGMPKRQVRKPARYMGQSSVTPKRKPDPSAFGRGGRTF